MWLQLYSFLICVMVILVKVSYCSIVVADLYCICAIV